MSKVLNADEFVQALDLVASAIAKSIPNALQVVANDAVALIQSRLQEKGLDGNEQELPAYSPGYKKKKVAARKDKGFTNLTLSGDMLHNLKVESSSLNGSQYTTTVGFPDVIQDKKAQGNSKHYGDILSVTKKEEEIFQKTFDAELQRVINESGFGA